MALFQSLKDSIANAGQYVGSNLYDVVRPPDASKSVGHAPPSEDWGDRFQNSYSRAVKSTAKKIWRGTLEVAASGFGKGVLIAAGIAALGIGLSFAFAATAGMFFVANPLGAGMIAGTMGQALGAAAATTGNFIFSGLGAIVLGIGGALGATAEVKKEHARMTADMARAEAREYALARQLEQIMQPPVPAPAAVVTPVAAVPVAPPIQPVSVNCNFCEREQQRRDQPNVYQQNLGIS